jgi:hypothetical protein
MYILQDYQKGVEPEQARIGIEASRTWAWPFAYDAEDLLKIHAQPDFDPDTRIYCTLGGEMVGYIFSLIHPGADGEARSATLEFPRMTPGHEQAAELLVARSFEVLKRKGVSRVEGRVSTMCPEEFPLAEKMGFSLTDRGYKIYYSYEMGWGKVDAPAETAEEMDPARDMEACAEIASHWYKRPPDWCRARLEEWHVFGLLAHLCVREEGRPVAACLAARNILRPPTAANYYIHTPDEQSLKPLLVKVIDRCVEHGIHDLIADLVNEQRRFEPVYQELGFKKAAEWAKCEKMLT